MNSNWSYSPETKSWVVTSVTLTFDLWPWPFAWTLPWSNVITPENFMMIRWWEHSQKGVTDGQTDGQTDRRTENTIHRAAWSQLKTPRLEKSTNCDYKLIVSEGGHDTSACKILGHSHYAFSGKWPETPNLTHFTKSKWRQKEENQQTMTTT